MASGEGGSLYRGEGGGGGCVREENNSSICNLLNLLLFFAFSSIKLLFRRIPRRARCEICSKLKIKAPDRVRKVNDNFNNKTPLMSFWSPYC